MRKTIFTRLCLLLFAIFIVSACNRLDNEPVTPVDETKDRGHDLPNKVELIFRRIGSSEVQKSTIEKTSSSTSFEFDNTISLKEGADYHFEIVYYKNNRRMNHEFIDGKMAQIHQHFFNLQKLNPAVSTGIERISPEEMNQILTYEYQDTDPEDGILGQNGTKLRLRTWDPKRPEATDPIGLKGIIKVNKTNLQHPEYIFRIRLAHFLVTNKLEPETAEPRLYNQLSYSGAFAIDTDLRLPMKIIK